MTFKYELNQKVLFVFKTTGKDIKDHEQYEGEVIGRSDHVDDENEYRLSYYDKEGRLDEYIYESSIIGLIPDYGTNHTDWFKEGFDSCQNGKDKNNPYQAGTHKYLEWDRGYVTCLNNPDYIQNTLGWDQLTFE